MTNIVIEPGEFSRNNQRSRPQSGIVSPTSQPSHLYYRSGLPQSEKRTPGLSQYLPNRTASTSSHMPYRDKLVISFCCSKALTNNDYKELVNIVGTQKNSENLFIQQPKLEESPKKISRDNTAKEHCHETKLTLSEPTVSRKATSSTITRTGKTNRKVFEKDVTCLSPARIMQINKSLRTPVRIIPDDPEEKQNNV